jgi:hypothetical protein
MSNKNLLTDAKFALVIAERQKYVQGMGVSVQANWQQFSESVRNNAQPPEGTETIHDNYWLIPLATGLPFLATLIRLGDSYSVPIHILFVEESPVWIKYPPNEKQLP